jgi:hypothetical protein
MHDGSAELKEAHGPTVKRMTVVHDKKYCAVEVECRRRVEKPRPTSQPKMGLSLTTFVVLMQPPKTC